ncbi:MAG: methyl-accepting chemotaxis protein [Verrucomicrobiota bacterium]
MNLQTKCFASISAAVLAVLISAEVFRQQNESHTLADLSRRNLARLESTTRGNVRNLDRAIKISLYDAMAQGEMDRLTQIMERQRQVEGLLECSLLDGSGKVAYSSSPEARKRPLEAALRDQILMTGSAVERQTADAFELYQPLKAEKSCLECHSEWKEGQMGGIQFLRLSNQGYRQAQIEWADSVARLRRNRLLAGCAVSLTVLIALVTSLVLVLRRVVLVPLGKAGAVLARLSRGDLTADVEVVLQTRRDEIGDFARALQAVTASWRALLRELMSGVHTLAASSAELSSVSRQSASGVQSTSAKATTVAAAADEMSGNCASVASGIDETSQRLTTVAQATEEMTQGLAEIANESERAQSITADATRQAEHAEQRMQQLSAAAKDIGKVSDTITTISEQTKLLALNATIEAARAGAAGKGFTVVAQSIGELARQTADATSGIRAKVAGIQTSTAATLTDLGQISRVVEQVSQLVDRTASAIRDQSTATKEIARNVTEAAGAVETANSRVAKITAVSRGVATEMATLEQAAGEIAAGSDRARQHSVELAHLAEGIQRSLARFQIEEGTGSERDHSPAGVELVPGTRKMPMGPLPSRASRPERAAQMALTER